MKTPCGTCYCRSPPTAPMRPPGFDAYSRATRSAGFVRSRAPPPPRSSRSRRGPLVAPTARRRGARQGRADADVPARGGLSELRSRLEARGADHAEVAELRARLDFVERASPHYSPTAPIACTARTRAPAVGVADARLGVNADHAGERAWPMVPRRLFADEPTPARRDPLSAPPGSATPGARAPPVAEAVGGRRGRRPLGCSRRRRRADGRHVMTINQEFNARDAWPMIVAPTVAPTATRSSDTSTPPTASLASAPRFSCSFSPRDLPYRWPDR